MSASIVDALRYDRWATLTLIDACRSLTKEQLASRAPGTSGTIAELFTHLVGGQRTFALRTQGRQHEGEWGRTTPWPGFDALRAAAVEGSDELIAIGSAIRDDDEADLPFQGNWASSIRTSMDGCTAWPPATGARSRASEGPTTRARARRTAAPR